MIKYLCIATCKTRYYCDSQTGICWATERETFIEEDLDVLYEKLAAFQFDQMTHSITSRNDDVFEFSFTPIYMIADEQPVSDFGLEKTQSYRDYCIALSERQEKDRKQARNERDRDLAEKKRVFAQLKKELEPDS